MKKTKKKKKVILQEATQKFGDNSEVDGECFSSTTVG